MHNREEKIKSILEKYINNPELPGIAIGILHNDEWITFSAGVADDNGTHCTTETNFRLASVSKEFTAYAAVILIEKEIISFSDSIKKFLPELNEYHDGITIYHLLHHTSGIYDYEDLIPKEQTTQVDDVAVLGLISKSKPYFQAGRKYQYSNSGYVLLGLIVERASKISFPEFLRQNIWSPLMMKHTVLGESESVLVPHRAFGFCIDEKGKFIQKDQSTTSRTRGDGCIYSSVNDMKLWLEELRKPRLLSEASSKLLYEIPKDIHSHYGCGWFIEKKFGRNCIYHGGETKGFRTAVVRFPDENLHIVVLSNREIALPRLIAHDIAKIFFKE